MSWQKISMLLLVAMASVRGAAQVPTFGSVHRMFPGAPADTEAVALVDVDADGDNDALTSDGLALNDGTGIFTDAPTTSLPPGFGATAFAMGDVDGDGDPDILTSDAVYLNDGTGVFADATATHLPLGFGATALVLGDVDGDGDLDALTGNDGQQNGLYLNNGSGVFGEVTATNLPPDSDLTAAIALGDVDADGDLDAVIGNKGPACPMFPPCPGGQNRLYLNDGTGVFSDATAWSLPANLANTTVIALSDMDGDGDLDALVGNTPITPGWSGGPQGGNDQLYVNDGTGVFAVATSSTADSTRAFAVGDLNGDGSLDLMAGNGGQNQLHLSSSLASTNVTLTNLPRIDDDTHALAFGDVDADGDLDVLIGNHGQNYLYLNDGTGVFADATRLDLPAAWCATWSLALGDVDGDGDLDAFMAASGDPFFMGMGFTSGEQDRLLINDGVGVFSDATAASLPSISDFTAAVALGDVDGDGDLDALTGGHIAYGGPFSSAQSRLYLNDGLGVFADATATHWPQVEGEPALSLGDLDGDGDLDILTYGGLYLNDGQGIFSDATATNLPGSPWAWALALGDVDGDGDLDALTSNELYLNDGQAIFTSATAANLPPNHVAGSLALGDVDGDGDLDALLGQGAAQNRLYRNDGTGVFTDITATHLPPDADATSDVAFGDVDEDGDLDAILANGGTGAGQQSRLYLNDGTGVFTDATAGHVPPGTGGTMAVALGDLDGDGDLDALMGRPGDNRLLVNLTRQLAWRGLPRFGKPLTIDFYGPQGEGWTFCISLGSANIPVPPAGTLRLDLATLGCLGGGTLDAQGRASLTYAIPPNPGMLTGATIMGQALVGTTDPRLTNLELFTFTNL